MLGSIVLLGSADGMKRSPSLVGDALKDFMSGDVIRNDDGNADLSSQEAAVLRWETKRALDVLKNEEETDKAAIERLSSENQEVEYDAELVKKAWGASGVTDEQGNAESLPDDMPAAVSRLIKLWGTEAGKDMLADSSEEVLGKREGTIEEVVKRMIVDPVLITREEIIQKAKDKALQAVKDAEDKASQAVRDAKEEASQAVRDAEDKASQAVRDAEDKASQAVRDAEDKAAKSLTNMKKYRGLVATLQSKIKELEAALAQAQATEAQKPAPAPNAPETKETAKAQAQTPAPNATEVQKPTEDQVKETQENVDDDIPVMKLNSKTPEQNAPKSQKPAQAPASKAAEAKKSPAPRGQKFAH